MRRSSSWRRSCCRAGRRASLTTWCRDGGWTLDGWAGRACGCRLGAGNRSVVGYCVAVGYKPAGGRKLKAIADGARSRSRCLSPSMLRLTRWMADYYLCPWGQVLEAVVPAGVRHEAGTRDVTLLVGVAGRGRADRAS